MTATTIILIAAILVLWVAALVAVDQWIHWDYERRSARLVHRNLQRTEGRR